jgi:hypothetical protein
METTLSVVAALDGACHVGRTQAVCVVNKEKPNNFYKNKVLLHDCQKVKILFWEDKVWAERAFPAG